MLEEDSNLRNPLIRSRGANHFAIISVQQLPLEVFSREHRERILTSWVPLVDDLISIVDALGPMVLALKTKLAHRSAFYEASHLSHLARNANI